MRRATARRPTPPPSSTTDRQSKHVSSPPHRCISAASRLHLGCISGVSRLYLGCISQTEHARLESPAPPQLADGSANSANSRAESADPLEAEVSEAVRDETLLLPAPPYASGSAATAQSPRADENWPPADASSPWAGVDLIASRDAVGGGVDEEEQTALMDELNNDLEVSIIPHHYFISDSSWSITAQLNNDLEVSIIPHHYFISDPSWSITAQLNNDLDVIPRPHLSPFPHPQHQSMSLIVTPIPAHPHPHP